MVEMARAIVDRPRVLLLDEPTSGLDATESARLGQLIQSIRSDASCSVLLVEHDVSFMMDQVDRITVLDLGRVLAVGAPEEIKRDPRVRTAYLGEM
jgi:branched-chain amino acid transport system ATP-binding protein